MEDRDHTYAAGGRRGDVAVINFTCSKRTAEKLRAYAGVGPGKTKTGRLGAFVENLVHDYEVKMAREDERRRVEDRVLSVLGRETDEHQTERV